MTTAERQSALAARVAALEAKVYNLQRPQATEPPRFRELLDASLGAIRDGQAPVYRTTTGRFEPGSFGKFYVDGADHGMVGDDLTDETGPFSDAIDATPPGGMLFVPPGVHQVDPTVSTKAITVFSLDRYSGWLKPRTNYSAPVLTFDLPNTSPTGSTRGYYGGGVRDIGFDLATAPAATGLKFGYTNSGGGWMRAVGCYFGGGAVSVECDMPNCWIEDVVAFDAGKFFVIDGETGLELTMRDIAMGRNTSGTTTCGIEVLCATTASIKGALMMQNVRLASGTGGGVSTTMGMRVAATKASGGDPDWVSVPVFADGVILDNITGPGLVLERVRDVHYDNGWINSAAGGPCVRIAGGGNLTFRGNDYFGGGSPTKTYDFVSGSGLCDGFTSVDNFCPTNTVYYLPASDKPKNMHLGDRCILDSGIGPVPITNDIAGLYSGATWTIGTRKFNDRMAFSSPPVFNEATAASGIATLAGGSVAVSCNHADSTFSQIIAFRRVPGGTLGFLSIASITTGVGFTIQSSSATDTSQVGWMMFRRA